MLVQLGHGVPATVLIDTASANLIVLAHPDNSRGLEFWAGKGALDTGVSGAVRKPFPARKFRQQQFQCCRVALVSIPDRKIGPWWRGSFL